MTEKEKMLSGELYDGDHDDELLMNKQRAKTLCRRFNDAEPNDLFTQKQTIRQLFNKVSDNFVIEQPFHCDFGYNITVGDNFYANVNCVILDEAPVTMGHNVFFGPQCCICTVGHPADVEQRARGLMYAHPITIGDNVWIGANVTILPGVTIGANTIIGAGSVVTRDIPANVKAYGNPCRPVENNH